MLPKTGIEYLDRVYNPVKGRCPTNCWYCYMKRPPSSWSVDKNPTLRFDEKALRQKFPENPSRIGVGFNIELFHPEIPNGTGHVCMILEEIKNRGQDHTFIFLTKFPERYTEFDFPKNCWLGVTVTKQKDQGRLDTLLFHKQGQNLIFASIEPLLENIEMWQLNTLDWIIIGALTGRLANRNRPERNWIEPIVGYAIRMGLPIFMKDNLKKVWGKKLIQEFPEMKPESEGR